MKKEFLDFLNALMEAAPDVAKEKMTDNVKAYIDTLISSKNDKPEITDSGKIILDYMQKSDLPMFKAKDIGEKLAISSRGAAATIRKLITDGYVEKFGDEPVVYSLTTLGENFSFNE